MILFTKYVNNSHTAANSTDVSEHFLDGGVHEPLLTVAEMYDKLAFLAHFI
jgi:hypothetical protein